MLPILPTLALLALSILPAASSPAPQAATSTPAPSHVQTLITYLKVPLYDGNTVVTAEYEAYTPVIDLVEAFSLARRDSSNCKGSSRCKGLDPGSCDRARNKILDSQVYTNTGSVSGTCSGNCGIFVQSTNGASCAFTGKALEDAYTYLRVADCKVCGSYVFSSGCEITINYVTGC